MSFDIFKILYYSELYSFYFLFTFSQYFVVIFFIIKKILRQKKEIKTNTLYSPTLNWTTYICIGITTLVFRYALLHEYVFMWAYMALLGVWVFIYNKEKETKKYYDEIIKKLLDKKKEKNV